jgi:hypothetical protein
MTDPLIDPGKIAVAVYQGGPGNDGSTAAVMAYLRSVLTPDALRIFGTDSWRNGHYLYHRIFGEDK